MKDLLLINESNEEKLFELFGVDPSMMGGSPMTAMGIRVMVSPLCPVDKVYLIDSAKFKYRLHRPLFSAVIDRILPDGLWSRLRCRLRWWWEDVVKAWKSIWPEVKELLEARHDR